MSLEDLSSSRKARLQALQGKSAASGTPTVAQGREAQPAGAEGAPFQLVSRNFNIETKTNITGFAAPPAPPAPLQGAAPPPTFRELNETVEAVSQQVSQQALGPYEEKALLVFEGGAGAEPDVQAVAALGGRDDDDKKRDMEEEMAVLNKKTDEVLRRVLKQRVADSRQ